MLGRIKREASVPESARINSSFFLRKIILYRTQWELEPNCFKAPLSVKKNHITSESMKARTRPHYGDGEIFIFVIFLLDGQYLL